MARPRYLRELVWITGVLVLASACKRNAAPDVPKDAGTAQTSAATPGAVRLLSAGLGQKRTLAYRIPERLSSSMVMFVDASITIERIGVEPRHVDLPTVRIVVDSLRTQAPVKKGEPQATFPIETVIREARLASVAGVPPEFIRTTGKELESLAGAKSKGTMTAQGYRAQDPFLVPEGGSETRGQIIEAVELAIELMSPPLPDRPVGVGANWQIDEDSVVAGVRVHERMTFELDDLAAHTGRLKVKIEQDAERQPTELPGLPKGTAAAELVGLKGEGSGDIEFDLESLTPLGARIAVQDELDYRQKEAGDRGALRVKSSIILRVEKL